MKIIKNEKKSHPLPCTLLALVLIISLFSGCSNAPSPISHSSEIMPVTEDSETSSSENEPVSREKAEKRARQLLSEMTEDQKIGQVLLMDFRQWAEEEGGDPVNVTALNEDIRAIIQNYHLGNIILFYENCLDTASLTKLTYDLQMTALDGGDLPLLIGTDQEGGNVTRLATGCSLSGSMAIGSTDDPENAALAGTILGRELRAVGINCDFAPDADVNTNPNNPIIGIRSFSDDPQEAAVMVEAMAKALGENGIAACAKHFPGHGDTDTDSHTGLPLVERSREEWLESDAVPFRRLAENSSIPMIMSAHIQYPGLDDTQVASKESGESIYLPATLSQPILTGILKGDLGFDGVIVTDALQMDAIKTNFGQNEAALMALNAGADLLCMPLEVRCNADTEQLESLYQAFRDALSDGTLPLDRLNDAVQRVLVLKITAGILDAEYNIDPETAAQEAQKVVGGEENRRLERQLADRCVALEYDGTFEPFVPLEGDKIVILMPYEDELCSTKYAVERVIREMELPPIETVFYTYTAEMDPLPEDILDDLASADAVIIGYELLASNMNDDTHWRNTVPKAIAEASGTDQIAILCTGLPYRTDLFRSEYPCFVLYNYTGMSEADIHCTSLTAFTDTYGPAIPAGIDAIFGNSGRAD